MSTKKLYREDNIEQATEIAKKLLKEEIKGQSCIEYKYLFKKNLHNYKCNKIH